MTTDPMSTDPNSPDSTSSGQIPRSNAPQPHPQPSQPGPRPGGQAQGAGSAGAGGSAPAAAGQPNPYFDFTDYQVRLPTSWPRSVRDGLPSFRDGIRTVVQTEHMPMDARIGYWIWLVGTVLATIGWFLSMAIILFGIIIRPLTLVGTGMMSIFGEFRWGVILFYFFSMILSLAILLLQLGLTLKIRERAEWARLGLTAVTVVSIVYSIILTAAGVESGGAGTVVVSLLSLAMLAFFWLPQANAWFQGKAGLQGNAGPQSNAGLQGKAGEAPGT